MNSGYIYIIWNEMYQFYGTNVYKIGKTQDINQRTKQFTTAYIEPVEIKFLSEEVKNYTLAEQEVFKLLKKHRMKANREFFRIDNIKDTIFQMEKKIEEINSMNDDEIELKLENNKKDKIKINNELKPPKPVNIELLPADVLNLSDTKLFKDEYIKLFGEDIFIKTYRKRNNTILDEYKIYLDNNKLFISFLKFITLFKTDDIVSENSNYDITHKKVFYLRKFEKICKITPFEVENNVEFIKINTDISDDEWDIIKGIFRSSKTKPVNKFEGVKLYKLLLNNICGEIDIFNKGKNMNINKIQYVNYTFDIELLRKLLILLFQTSMNFKYYDVELLKLFLINTEILNNIDVQVINTTNQNQ